MTASGLRNTGFVGRILDSDSPDYAPALRRANVSAERKAKFVVFPTSTEDVQFAVIYAIRSVYL